MSNLQKSDVDSKWVSSIGHALSQIFTWFEGDTIEAGRDGQKRPCVSMPFHNFSDLHLSSIDEFRLFSGRITWSHLISSRKTVIDYIVFTILVFTDQVKSIQFKVLCLFCEITTLRMYSAHQNRNIVPISFRDENSKHLS